MLFCSVDNGIEWMTPERSLNSMDYISLQHSNNSCLFNDRKKHPIRLLSRTVRILNIGIIMLIWNGLVIHREVLQIIHPFRIAKESPLKSVTFYLFFAVFQFSEPLLRPNQCRFSIHENITKRKNSNNPKFSKLEN